MELNCETTTLSFSKGMTNIPSDMISEDGELMESVGFVYRNGEMVPIQKPVCITGDNPVEGKLVYCHKQADYRNLVTYIKDEQKLNIYINFEEGNTVTRTVFTAELGAKLLGINAVGNTLVCATDKGLHYILCKGNSYKDLGTELPIPKVEFYTDGTVDNWQKKQDDLKKDSFMCNIESFVDLTPRYAFYHKSGEDMHKLYATDPDQNKYDPIDSRMYWHHAVKQDKDTDFKNAVVGHVEQMINWVKDKNKFAFPFFVRFALKMFDGSYCRISNPIICYPSISKNWKFVEMGKSSKGYYEEGVGTKEYMFHIGYSGLFFKASIENKENWSDIIKEIVVFATEDVKSFDLDKDWKFKDPIETDNTVFYNGGGSYHENVIEFRDSTYGGGGYHPLASEWLMPVFKTENKMIKELLEKTQFYKLFSLDMNSKYLDGEWHDSSEKNESASDVNIIEDGTVSTLTEQEQLKVDDYYGWTRMVSEKLFTYNSRINTIGVKRYPFKGFNFFTENKTPGNFSYEYYVHIVNRYMDTWVKSEPNNNADPIFFTGWLYYPDANAKEMIIRRVGDSLGWRVPLKQHKMLNGAYSFVNLPHTGKNVSISNIEVPVVADGYEYLDSQIFTSVVNNPFVFEASGDNTVGTGKIYGIVSNTEAVSTGQFGQYPLLVFTSEGIYGMSVNAEGLYSASYPISREVCNENSPFVPTGNMVFFTGMKGLMATTGGSVAFMSNKMSGYQPSELRTLDDGAFSIFLEDCMIAYDYNQSLLRIYAKGKSYQYIYNTVDQTFAMDNSGMEAQAIVNDYPDNLIQDTEGNVYSLTDKPVPLKDENLYSGYLITRPLKFTGSEILKSLRQIGHLKKSADGKLSLEVWASNNAVNWCKLVSLGGKPWAYFTFKYNLSDFKASDAFAGSLVRVQNRRSLMHDMEF